jgi:hypothetical protein
VYAGSLLVGAGIVPVFSTPAPPFASATIPILTSSSGAVSIPVLPAIMDQTQISSVATIRSELIHRCPPFISSKTRDIEQNLYPSP